MRGARPRPRPLAVLAAAVLGAVIGTAWDRMHVAAGTLAYRDPGTLGQPWWVPLQFGLAFAAGLVAISRFGDPVPEQRSLLRALGEALWFTGVYGTTALLWRSPGILTVLMVVLLLVRTPALQHTGGANIAPAIAVVAGGPAVEAIISASGLFAYAGTRVFGIPIWLPVLYMHLVPLAVRFSEAMLWHGGRRVVIAGEVPPKALETTVLAEPTAGGKTAEES